MAGKSASLQFTGDWSIWITGMKRFRFSLWALVLRGGSLRSPLRLSVSRTSRQAMSFKRPLDCRQFHSRQRISEMGVRPLSQCLFTVSWMSSRSCWHIVLFLMVMGLRLVELNEPWNREFIRLCDSKCYNKTSICWPDRRYSKKAQRT